MWERKLSIPSDKRIKQLIDVARKYGFNTDFEKIKADYKK
jgi:ribosomal protein S8